MRRLVLACGLAAMACVAFGCAVGQAPNGKMVVGLGVADSGQIETPVEKVEAAASLLPSPWDKIVIGGLGLGAAWLGRERGRHTGWDEAKEAEKIPVTDLRRYLGEPQSVAVGGAGVQPETGSSLSSRTGV